MVTLDRLINILGGYGARLVGTARARDIELRSVAMHDPTALQQPVGDAFLAVGVTSTDTAVELATTAHAAVLLVRGDAEPNQHTTAALSERGLAMLLVDPAVSWSQIAEVVYGLVFEGRETESGRGPIDLFALADSIAAAVGGPVTIEDQLSRVLAYSSRQHDADAARHETILGRRVPDATRELFDQRGVFTHLAASDEPLFVPPSAQHGLRGRMVAAVRAGRELLGSLWVNCDAPLPDKHARVLTDSAHTVAMHLLRSRVSADLERQIESELVIQLLEGTAEAAAVIGKLGLPPRRSRVIALQAHSHGEHHAAILLAFERATTGFGWSRPGRSALFGNTVYTILPCDDDPRPARSWLRDTIHNLPSETTTAAGIGGPASPAELPASRHEADESLALHTQRPGDPIAYDESWDQILLQRLRAAAAAGRTPTRGPIADLAHHDSNHASHYLPTLRAWLENQGDLTTTATHLDLHPNTVRYRLRKMSQITNLHLEDPAQRLAMLITLAVNPPEDTRAQGNGERAPRRNESRFS